jgi:hypothetical protein
MYWFSTNLAGYAIPYASRRMTWTFGTIFMRPQKWYILNLYGLSTRYGYLSLSNNPSIIRAVAVSQTPFNSMDYGINQAR